MQIAKHKEIIAPFAWNGPELQDSTGWIRPFRQGELAEIDAALKGVKRRGLAWVDITREDFPLPAGYELVFGSIEAGAVRGGVPSREGWRDATQLRARRSKS